MQEQQHEIKPVQKQKPTRRIRSFVRRQGRITQSQEKALVDLWGDYGVDLSSEALDEALDFEKIFERAAPTIIEIGFGNGTSLLQMAQAHPENNYVGIEVHRPGVGVLLSDIEKQQVNNLRVMCDDAVIILEKMILDNSLAGFQIFFPDPWHKKRHNKRRLIQEKFVKLLANKLRPGGFIHLATDWQAYAEQMMEVLSNNDDLKNASNNANGYFTEHDRPETKFERRGLRLGHGVWDLMFCRK